MNRRHDAVGNLRTVDDGRSNSAAQAAGAQLLARRGQIRDLAADALSVRQASLGWILQHWRYGFLPVLEGRGFGRWVGIWCDAAMGERIRQGGSMSNEPPRSFPTLESGFDPEGGAQSLNVLSANIQKLVDRRSLGVGGGLFSLRV